MVELPDNSGDGPRVDRSALAEAGLLYLLLWLRFPPAAVGASPPGPDSPSYHLALIAALLPCCAYILFRMLRSEGLYGFCVEARVKPRDMAGAVILALLLGLLASLPALLSRLLGAAGFPGSANPLLDSLGRPTLSPWLFLPLVALAALATGYAEELFFRFWLPRRLSQGGLGEAASIVLSALMFGAAHGNQGPLAAVVATAMAALLSLRKRGGGSWHELALGHALYDFAVLMMVLYPQGLGFA
ncbi:MAG: CPBP family intramembrane glutamic endopeptidase [Spirochaetota bacterium]